MKYFVTIGEQIVEVDVDGERIRVGGQECHASIDRSGDSPEFRLLLDGKSWAFAEDGRVEGSWRVVDRGMVQEVPVEDERTRHIRMLAGTGKTASRSGVVKAPMPGLVVRIDVAVGDQVAAGSPLLVLEAMKMENEIKSVAPGTVKAIRVAPKQAVEKGQVLLEIEPLP